MRKDRTLTRWLLQKVVDGQPEIPQMPKTAQSQAKKDHCADYRERGHWKKKECSRTDRSEEEKLILHLNGGRMTGTGPHTDEPPGAHGHRKKRGQNSRSWETPVQFIQCRSTLWDPPRRRKWLFKGSQELAPTYSWTPN